MNNINIKVNGKGQLNIGNLAQGQDVRISSGDINLAKSETALIRELLELVRDAAGGDNARVEAVQGKVKELGEAMEAEPKNPGKIKNILSLIKENHDWAFPVISGFVTKIIPALGVLL
jgi:hypothetical protein